MKLFLYFIGTKTPRSFEGKFPKNHIVIHFGGELRGLPKCTTLYSTWFPNNSRSHFNIKETNKRFQERMKTEKDFHDWIGS